MKSANACFRRVAVPQWKRGYGFSFDTENASVFSAETLIGQSSAKGPYGSPTRMTLPSESVSHHWLYFVVVVAVDKWEAAFCFPLIHSLLLSLARR